MGVVPPNKRGVGCGHADDADAERLRGVDRSGDRAGVGLDGPKVLLAVFSASRSADRGSASGPSSTPCIWHSWPGSWPAPWEPPRRSCAASTAPMTGWRTGPSSNARRLDDRRRAGPLHGGRPSSQAPQFPVFFFGQLISVTGTWMQTLALAWLMGTLVGWTRPSCISACWAVVQFMPVLVLGLFGGSSPTSGPSERP